MIYCLLYIIAMIFACLQINNLGAKLGHNAVENLLSETITLSVNGLEPTATENYYSCLVQITFEGQAPINQEIYHDAFHQWNINEKTRKYFQGLEIDSKQAYFEIYTIAPEYESDHIYTFIYNVGNEPRPIQFQINSQNQKIVHSAFTVTVQSLAKSQCR